MRHVFFFLWREVRKNSVGVIHGIGKMRIRMKNESIIVCVGYFAHFLGFISKG